jgi:hypothetical protein
VASYHSRPTGASVAPTSAPGAWPGMLPGMDPIPGGTPQDTGDTAPTCPLAAGAGGRCG